MARKRSELDEKDREFPEAGKSYLRRLAEKGLSNYEETVGDINKGMNQAMMRLDPEHEASGIRLDLPAAGTIKSVVGSGAKLGKSQLGRLAAEHGPERAELGKKFYDSLDELFPGITGPDKMKKLNRYMKDLPEEASLKYKGRIAAPEASTAVRTAPEDIALSQAPARGKSATSSSADWVAADGMGDTIEAARQSRIRELRKRGRSGSK